MAATSQNLFEIISGNYGNKLIVRSVWQEEFFSIINEYNIIEIELNNAKGWKGSDISFLQNIPNLISLQVIDWQIKDVSPIHHLHKLNTLDINTMCGSTIDFSNFPELENVCLEWREKGKSIFQCKSLNKIFLNNYSGKSLNEFGNLASLTSLSLKSPKLIELGNTSKLVGLKFLGIYNVKKLSSLQGLECLTNLESLEIVHCRLISDIKPLESLAKLKRLQFCDNGDIESLRPIFGLNNIEELYFYESTNVLDGNISPLKALPNLRRISFQDRKHYNCRRAEFKRDS